MKKTILCYGDSNTWGYNAENGDRFPADIRWTGVLQKLKPDYYIIEEGLNGRTTVWDDPIECHKNGKTYLMPCLETHSPIDLVIIMLGTNDLKKRFSLSAFDIAAGAGELVYTCQNQLRRAQKKAPEILLISPIHVGDNIKNSYLNEMFGYEESIYTSKKFANNFKHFADQYGCEFLDAADTVVATSKDSIHFDKDGHLNFAKVISNKISDILND